MVASCPDGEFNLSFPKILFMNEAETRRVSTTVMQGGLSLPCTPRLELSGTVVGLAVGSRL